MTNRKLLIAGMLVLALVACAQGPRYQRPDALPPPSLLPNGKATGLVTVRVIVQFKQPVAYSDEAFVKTLEQQAQEPVRYLSAVSADTHVYGIQMSVDQAPQAAIQRIAALPSVGNAELDEKAR